MDKNESIPAPQRRRHRQRPGFLRLAVRVRMEDVRLVREIASALCDPERESKTRAILREKITTSRPSGFKAMLASAPFEGIEIERQHDVGRGISL